MSATIILGIDPGFTGAVATLALWPARGVQLLDVQDMPVASVKSGRSTKSEVLLPQLATLIQSSAGVLDLPVQAYIENVHAMPGQGVTSMFRFGKVFGNLEGVLAALNIPTTHVSPAEWQRVAQVRKDPDAGRLRASQLFPRRADLFARKKDHNRADAALIAYAGAYQALGRFPPILP